MAEIAWEIVWRDVAQRLREHRAAGRGHLLTEDVVRFQTVLALERLGVAPSRLRTEVPVPVLSGGKLDLAVDPPDGPVVELKYPRSRSGINPDTMTFGELVRDFFRVAAVPSSERWVVQVVEERLERYIHGICGRHGIRWATAVDERLLVPAASLRSLPETARRALGTFADHRAVSARCVAAEAVDDGLTLYAYEVDAVAAVYEEETCAPGAVRPSLAPAAPTPADASRNGARQEILEAARSLVARSGRSSFSIAEVVDEMHRRGTGYEDSTIRTMVASHMCVDASGPGVANYADLKRVDRGLYQLASEAPSSGATP